MAITGSIAGENRNDLMRIAREQAVKFYEPKDVRCINVSLTNVVAENAIYNTLTDVSSSLVHYTADYEASEGHRWIRNYGTRTECVYCGIRT